MAAPHGSTSRGSTARPQVTSQRSRTPTDPSFTFTVPRSPSFRASDSKDSGSPRDWEVNEAANAMRGATISGRLDGGPITSSQGEPAHLVPLESLRRPGSRAVSPFASSPGSAPHTPATYSAMRSLIDAPVSSTAFHVDKRATAPPPDSARGLSGASRHLPTLNTALAVGSVSVPAVTASTPSVHGKPATVGSRLLSYIGLRKKAKTALPEDALTASAPSALPTVMGGTPPPLVARTLDDARYAPSGGAALMPIPRSVSGQRIMGAAGMLGDSKMDLDDTGPRRWPAARPAEVEDEPMPDVSDPQALADALESQLGSPPSIFDAQAFDDAAAAMEAAYAEDCEKLATEYANATNRALLDVFKVDPPQYARALMADARRKRKLRTLLERYRLRAAAAESMAVYTRAAVDTLKRWNVNVTLPVPSYSHADAARASRAGSGDSTSDPREGSLPSLLRSGSRDLGAEPPAAALPRITTAYRDAPEPRRMHTPISPPMGAPDKIVKLYELVNTVHATQHDDLIGVDAGEMPLLAVGTRLRAGDEAFRKLVRDVFKLPAFLGLVMFQRVVEAAMVADVEVALTMSAIRDLSTRVDLLETANEERLDVLRYVLLGELPLPFAPPHTAGRGGSKRRDSVSGEGKRPGTPSSSGRASPFPSAPASAKIVRTNSSDALLAESRGARRTTTQASAAGASMDYMDLDLTAGDTMDGMSQDAPGITPLPSTGSGFPALFLGDAIAARRASGAYTGTSDPTFNGSVTQLNALSASWVAATSVVYDLPSGALLEHYLVPPPSDVFACKLQTMPEDISITRAGVGARTHILSPANPEEAYLRRAADRIRKQARSHVTTHGVITILDLARVWHPALEREKPDDPHDVERRRNDRIALLLAPSPDPVIIKLVHEMREAMRRRVSRWKHADDPDEPASADPKRSASGASTGAPRRAATTSAADTSGVSSAGRALHHQAASVSSASGPKLLPSSSVTGGSRSGIETAMSLDPFMENDGAFETRTGAGARPSVTTEIPGGHAVSALTILHACLAELGERLASAGVSTTPRLPCLLPGLRARHTHRVMMEDVAPLIEALVERHPSLADISRNATDSQRFVVCALASVFASVPQGGRLTGVPVWEVLDSSLAAALYQCSSSYTIATPPVSLPFFQDVCADFNAAVTFTKHADTQRAKDEQADASRRARGLAPDASGATVSFGRLGGSPGSGGDTRDVSVITRGAGPRIDAAITSPPVRATGAGGVGASPELRTRSPEDVFGLKDPSVETDDAATVTLAAVRNQVDVTVPQQILERCFAGRPRPLMSGMTGRMTFEDFVFMIVCMHDRMGRRSSQEYWFRCADLDDDGVLSPLDMECVLEAKAWSLRELHQRAPNTHETMAAIQDLVSAKNPKRITLSDLRRNGSSVLFFEVLLSLRPSAAARNFLGGHG